MSSKSDVDSPSHAEVLARAERLLAASFRVSNVANFEPMTINQVHKLGGTAKAEQKKGGQNASQGTLISLGVSPDPQPGVRNSTNQKKTGNGGKSVHGEPADNGRMQFEDNRSLRSEAKHRGSLVAADNLSDIPDAVDVGANVFITYFLHAAEIERLIVINKDQLEEAIEMENEIEQMEGAYVKASEAVTKANAELVNQRAEYEALSKSHKQSMEMMKNEAQENLLRAQAAADLLKTRHEEELHTKEEELRTRLEEELLKHVKSSGHQVEGQEDKLHAALIETKAQFLREKESFKKMADDRLQRELLSLKNTMMVQMSAEVDRARREEQAKFDAEKQILVRELKDAHKDEKKGLEARLGTVNQKETTALRERIKSLEDQLVLKDKELQEKQRQHIVPIIETDRGSVDLCIGSELASPKEYSRKKPEMRSFMSPNNSVFNQTTSQKILKAQKYQPLMSSSKQRERDRSLLMDAKSAGHTEYEKDSMQLELDQANQDLKMPPYAEPQINLSSSRRTEGQSSSVQPRIDSNRYSEPPFDPNSYLRGSQPEQASLSRGHLDTSSHQNNPFDSYISSRHNFPVSYTNFSQLPNSKVYTPVEIGQSLDYQMNQASGQHNTGLRLDLFKPIDKTYYMPRNGVASGFRESLTKYTAVNNTQDRVVDNGWTNNPTISSAGKYSTPFNGTSATKGLWPQYKTIASPSTTNLDLHRTRNSAGLGANLLPSASMGNMQQPFIQRSHPIPRQVPLVPGTISNYAASRIIRSSQYKNR